MPGAKLSSVPLPLMRGGFNRNRDAGREEIADGLDVIDTDGELRRRDALSSVHMAPWFQLPAGATKLTGRLAAGSYTNYSDRTPTGADSLQAVYIGCDEQFDGFVWPSQPFAGALATGTLLRLQYSCVAWTAVPWWLDRTWRYLEGSSVMGTLIGNGHVSWHKDTFSSLWSKQTINSISAYWIMAWVANTSGTKVVQSHKLYEPGCRVFLLDRVTGIFPVRVGSRRITLLLSDRSTLRGLESGTQLGFVDSHVHGTKLGHLAIDEGAGVYDEQTWPTWTEGGGGGTRGTADRLTKDNNRTAWPIGHHIGGTVIHRDDATSPGAAVVTLADAAADRANLYEHCRLKVAAKGEEGPAVGEEREIVSSTTAGVLTFEDAFSATLDTDNDLDVQLPPAKLLIDGDPREYSIFETDTADTLELVSGRPYAPDPPAALDGEPCFWRIVRELRWAVERGSAWWVTLDPTTRNVLLGNGKCFLEWDGETLRNYSADRTSQAAENYVSALPDEVPGLENAQDLAMAQLDSKPPIGSYCVAHRGRLFVAGIPGRPHDIRYSAPHLTNVWPLVYEARIADAESDAISGLAPFYDRILAFTPTAIHEAQADDNGFFSFHPVCQVLGWPSAAAVRPVAIGGSAVLVGPNADGIYGYNGSEPQPILDDWDRILPGGVNRSMLHRSVAVTLQATGWYVCAVPSAGKAHNDRLVIWNFESKTFWVWSLAFGCSSLAVDIDSSGTEHLLVGTDDGHVATLHAGSTDDGSTVTGRAKSALITLAGTREFDISRLHVDVEALGSTPTLDVNVYASRRADPILDATIYLDSGDAVYGTSQWASDSTVLWAAKTGRNMSVGVRGGQRVAAAAFELSGSSRWRYRQGEASIIVRAKPERK